MKRLTITRDETGDEGTFSVGILTDGDRALGQWQFVELPWRNNEPGISCIPEGVYRAHVIQSPHFARAVYLLEDVPGRDLIELHPANWGGDRSKGFHSDLRGCASPGMYRTVLTPPHHERPQAAVTGSCHALDLLMEATAQEPIEIEFRWADEVGAG